MVPKLTETRTKTRIAIGELLARGVVPSARKVRELLGEGSLSTISDEIRRMSAEQKFDTNLLPAQSPEAVALGMPTCNNRHRLMLPPDTPSVTDALAAMTCTLNDMRAELAALRKSSEGELKVAYHRYEAVQRQAMLQVDAARIESAELRERLRSFAVDSQTREDALKGMAQQMRDENQRLLGRLAELQRVEQA